MMHVTKCSELQKWWPTFICNL